MEQLFYLEEHLSCLRYNDNMGLGFKFLNLQESVFFERYNKDLHYMVFLLEGKLSISYSYDEVQEYNSGEFFLIPKFSDFSCQAQTDSSLLIFTFDSLVSVCEKMQLQSYSKICLEIDDSSKSLTINHSLMMFIELLKVYLDNSMNCTHMHTIKHQELFLILRGYYKKEELAAFFRPIIGKHHDFRNLILENYLKVNGLEELVQLSGMSRSSFNTKFKETFGIPAHKWMLKQKAKYVKYRLADPEITLSDIMVEFNFNSATHFTRFCKQYFGCTPTALKKQIQRTI